MVDAISEIKNPILNAFAKTDDTIIILVPVIAYAHKYQRKRNKHGGIAQQHAVAHIHIAVTITVIAHGKYINPTPVRRQSARK